MRFGTYLPVAFIVVAAITVFSAAMAEAALQVYSLRGLKGFAVGVSELPDELRAVGLSEAEIYRQVSGRFRSAGIHVKTQRFAIAADPDLLIDIFGGEFIQGIISYCISVRLEQPVILERDSTLRTIATTWSQQFIGVAGYGTPPKTIYANLLQLVDQFIDEVRMVNGE